jgi:hypothetical protein
VPGLLGTVRRLLASLAHLMGTSGVWRSTVALSINCTCGWSGVVDAIEDTEDMSLSYTCAGCGWTETERY